MEPHWPFHYLPMPDCWPLLYTGITAEGLHRNSIELTPYGIIQICVLQTTPFHECDDDKIREARCIRPRPFYTCDNRPLLIQDLAQALLDLDTGVRDIAQEIERYEVGMRDAINVIANVRMYTALAKVQKRFIVRQKAEVDDMKDIEKRLKPHFRRMSNVSLPGQMQRYRSNYLENMMNDCYAAFMRYGPRRRYSTKSLCAALSSILDSFKLLEAVNIKKGWRPMYARLAALGCFTPQ
jgi:hypothetical protein